MALNKQVMEVMKSGGILIMLKVLSQKGFPDGENGYKIFELINSKYGAAIHSNSLWSHGLYSPWNSPGQNTGMGNLSFLQRIFPTQGSNPGLPHCRWILYQLSHQGSTFQDDKTVGANYALSMCVYERERPSSLQKLELHSTPIECGLNLMIHC